MRRKRLDNPAAKADLLRRLSAVRPDSQRRWGRMSAHQMICHLSDGFRIALGDKQAAKSGGILQRTLVKWVALNVPVPPPKGYRTLPEADQEAGGTRPEVFAADREALERLVARFTAEGWDCVGAEHPIFGKLTKGEWMRWGHLHMDHHLKQFGV